MIGSNEQTPRGVVLLGRAGLAARGIVYITIGILALMSGLGVGGGKVVDQRGAVGALGNSPFGPIVLWGTAIGLLAYVLWRFSQVIRGSRDKHGAKAWGKRAVALFSGIAYASIAATAFAQALGQSSGGGKGGSAQQQGAELALAQPLGRWIVAAIGAAVIAAALAQFYRALTAKFADRLDDGELSANQSLWARRAGRAGFTARGVAFGLIGWFFLQAALHDDASETGGLNKALQALASQPSGTILLSVVGAGLAFFGVYSLIEARYRRID